MSNSSRTLLIVAWTNVVTHVVGLALALEGMRPGTPAAPLADRLAYLATNPPGWWVGWASWMLCTPLVVAFFALMAERVPVALARLALIVSVVAVGIDLCCDVTFIVVFPRIAAMGSDAEPIFLIVERATGAISLVVANGFYTLAVLLLNGALHGRHGIPRAILLVGYGVGVFGFALAAAGFTGVAWHAEWATGPTIGLYCLWIVLVAHCLPASEAKP